MILKWKILTRSIFCVGDHYSKVKVVVQSGQPLSKYLIWAYGQHTGSHKLSTITLILADPRQP